MSRWTTPPAVGSRERIEQRVEQVLDLGSGQRPGRGDAVGERAPSQERHDEHEIGSVVLDLEQADDARMIEPAQQLGLPAQASVGLVDLCGGAVHVDALARHRPAVGVLGQLHHAHAAPAQHADDPVGHSGEPKPCIASNCSR